MVIYPYIIITNIDISVTAKNNCGWFVILAVSMNVVFNLAAAFIGQFFEIRAQRARNKKKNEIEKAIEEHVINRKKIIMHYPGQFPEFEAYVDFYLKK